MRRYDRSREKENEAHQEEEPGRHGKERARATGEQKGKEQTEAYSCTLVYYTHIYSSAMQQFLFVAEGAG